MPKKSFLSASCAMMLVLGACARPDGPTEQLPTPVEFDTMVMILNESPAARAQSIRQCELEQASQPPDGIEVIAAFLQVEPSEVASVLCPRLTDAIREGRLSLDDFKAMKAGKMDVDLVRRLAPLLEPAGIEL